MEEGKTLLGPGHYPDLSLEDYLSGPGINRSLLKTITKSPAHYAYAKTQSYTPSTTKATIFGSALHSLLLTPSLFEEEYYILPGNINRRTKEGKALYEYHLQEAGTKSMIDEEMYNNLQRAEHSLLKDPAIAKLLTTSSSHREESFFWKDTTTNLLCKCRPDLYVDDHFVIDFKTTNDSSPGPFYRSCEKYFYFLQAAMTLEGLKHHNIFPKEYIIVTLETGAYQTPPYFPGIFILLPTILEEAKLQYDHLLQKISECEQNAHFPSYAPAYLGTPLTKAYNSTWEDIV